MRTSIFQMQLHIVEEAQIDHTNDENIEIT